jgi:hypothetical protein
VRADCAIRADGCVSAMSQWVKDVTSLAIGPAESSEFLFERANLQFHCPGASILMGEMPVRLRNRVRIGLSNAYFWAGQLRECLVPPRRKVFGSLREISSSAPIESGLLIPA